MSIWEMRTFIETMKTLGFPKLISYASFRQPNFELVSEAAHWLLKRSDPTFSYPYEISTENDRVALINTICNHAWSKIHVRLNSRKLYAANDECVHELCKFAKVLGDASRETPTTALNDSSMNSDVAPQDAKDARQLAQDITQEGARLSDNLDAEHELKKARIAALQVPMEPELAERVLAQKNIEAREEVENLKLRLKELETDKESLTERIQKKREELERSKNRLQAWRAVKPAHLEEYDRVEDELRHVHQEYVKQFANLLHLEKEMEKVYGHEREKYQEVERVLARMQRKMIGQRIANEKAGQDPGMGIDDDDVDDDLGMVQNRNRQQQDDDDEDEDDSVIDLLQDRQGGGMKQRSNNVRGNQRDDFPMPGEGGNSRNQGGNPKRRQGIQSSQLGDEDDEDDMMDEEDDDDDFESNKDRLHQGGRARGSNQSNNRNQRSSNNNNIDDDDEDEDMDSRINRQQQPSNQDFGDDVDDDDDDLDQDDDDMNQRRMDPRQGRQQQQQQLQQQGQRMNSRPSVGSSRPGSSRQSSMQGVGSSRGSESDNMQGRQKR